MKIYQKPDALFVEARPILFKMQGTGEPLPQVPLDCEGPICDDEQFVQDYFAFCEGSAEVLQAVFLMPGEACDSGTEEQCSATINGQAASQICTGTGSGGEFEGVVGYGFNTLDDCKNGLGCLVNFYCVLSYPAHPLCEPGTTVALSCSGFEGCDMDVELLGGGDLEGPPGGGEQEAP